MKESIPERYPNLFVSTRSNKRGRTHCAICGGRTNQRDGKGKAVHRTCGGTGGRRKK